MNHVKEEKASIRRRASSRGRDFTDNRNRLLGLHKQPGRMDARPSAARDRRGTAGANQAERTSRAQKADSALAVPAGKGESPRSEKQFRMSPIPPAPIPPIPPAPDPPRSLVGVEPRFVGAPAFWSRTRPPPRQTEWMACTINCLIKVCRTQISTEKTQTTLETADFRLHAPIVFCIIPLPEPEE